MMASMASRRFFLVKRAFKRVIDLQKLDVMAPCQFSRHCLEFLIEEKEASHCENIALPKSFAIVLCQVAGKAF